jgi:hypothetical protein
MAKTITALESVPAHLLDSDDDCAIGECNHCGEAYFYESEGDWHSEKNCIGGDDRFDTREEYEGRW